MCYNHYSHFDPQRYVLRVTLAARIEIVVIYRLLAKLTIRPVF